MREVFIRSLVSGAAWTVGAIAASGIAHAAVTHLPPRAKSTWRSVRETAERRLHPDGRPTEDTTRIE